MASKVEGRLRRMEETELRILKVERNLYYTIGAIFGMLVFLSAMFIPILGRFATLGLVASPDPIASATHLFMGVFLVCMLFSFYKGFALEKHIP